MEVDSATELSPSNFKVTFETTNSIRMLVDVVSNVLKQVEFHVVQKEGFEGISIESIDSKQVCLIVCQLSCKVVHVDSDTKFCVDTNTFNTCLKSIPQHYSLDITNTPNTSDIFMHAYESLSQTYNTRFRLPTLVSEADRVTLSDLDYQYSLEIDLTTLRSIVRNTIALRGSDITIRVEEPEHATNRHTILSIISTGNAEQHHSFHSITDTKDGNSCVIRTDQNEIAENYSKSNLQKKYEETFSAVYLNDFLKSMERHIITAKLSPGKPLILTYQLGGDNESYICFVLAPRAD